jgi:diguanylate cyclase (GGDEF)-like protein
MGGCGQGARNVAPRLRVRGETKPVKVSHMLALDHDVARPGDFRFEHCILSQATHQHARAPVDEPVGGSAHWVAVGRDITARKAQEEVIEHLAFHDPLTGLPNRQLLLVRLQQALAQAAAGARIGALLFIDLDHFKLLNDTLGHIAGDAALVTVAQRVRDVIRRADTLARYGGEEFVVVAPEVDGPQAILIGEKLRLAIAERPILVGEQPTRLTVSVGVADMESYADAVRLRGEDPRTALPDPHLLLRLADERMYEAKQAGRNCVRYEPANR